MVQHETDMDGRVVIRVFWTMVCGVQTYVRGGGVVRVVVRVRMDEGVRCVTMMFPCTQGVIESSFRLTFRRAEAGV